jgi:hypothetical protein
MVVHYERLKNSLSAPFREEREGPIAKQWEGEVGIGESSGLPHLTSTLSAPGGLCTVIDL